MSRELAKELMAERVRKSLDQGIRIPIKASLNDVPVIKIKTSKDKKPN